MPTGDGAEGDALTEIRRFAHDHELPAPPIPEVCELGLQKVAKATWASEDSVRSLSQVGLFGRNSGTRNIGINLYLFKPWLSDFIESAPIGSFAFGMDGQGVNSYAVTLRLAVPGLKLALQAIWGGAYTGWNVARPDIEAMIATASQCLEWAEASRDSQPMAVVHSSARAISLIGRQDELCQHLQSNRWRRPTNRRTRWEDVAGQLLTAGER